MKQIDDLQAIIINIGLPKETENTMINLLASVHCKVSDLQNKIKSLEKENKDMVIDNKSLRLQTDKLKEVIKVSLDIKDDYY